jgi:hypothetical protein
VRLFPSHSLGGAAAGDTARLAEGRACGCASRYKRSLNFPLQILFLTTHNSQLFCLLDPLRPCCLCCLLPLSPLLKALSTNQPNTLCLRAYTHAHARTHTHSLSLLNPTLNPSLRASLCSLAQENGCCSVCSWEPCYWHGRHRPWWWRCAASKEAWWSVWSWAGPLHRPW